MAELTSPPELHECCNSPRGMWLILGFTKMSTTSMCVLVAKMLSANTPHNALHPRRTPATIALIAVRFALRFLDPPRLRVSLQVMLWNCPKSVLQYRLLFDSTWHNLRGGFVPPLFLLSRLIHLLCLILHRASEDALLWL